MNMYSRSALQIFLTRNFPIYSICAHSYNIIIMPTTQGTRPTYVYGIYRMDSVCFDRPQICTICTQFQFSRKCM